MGTKGIKVVTMKLQDIRANLKKADKELLLVNCKLFDKPQRKERILLEVTKNYFVVSRGFFSDDVLVIHLDSVQELTVLPNQQFNSGDSWKSRTKDARERYKKPRAKMQVVEQLSSWDDKTMPLLLIERLEVSAQAQKESAKFIELLDKLKGLL